MDVLFDWGWLVIEKTIIIFEITPALISENNLIADLSVTKKVLKTRLKSYGDEVADFHNKGMSKVYSNHACCNKDWFSS